MIIGTSGRRVAVLVGERDRSVDQSVDQSRIRAWIGAGGSVGERGGSGYNVARDNAPEMTMNIFLIFDRHEQMKTYENMHECFIRTKFILYMLR